MSGSLFAPPVAAPPRAGTYACIYADPPWLERGSGQIKRGADRHYPLMPTRAIAALPVESWAAPDAHLYCWVTNNFLPDGLAVVAAWGFRYVTMVSWFKDRIGIGQYYRGRTEHCLFAVRGRLPYRTKPDGLRAQGPTGFEEPELQDFSAARGEHSVKPEQMRRQIAIVSAGPYLELFARRPVDGWDVWGNEAMAEASLCE
jgi:N6-adenosine-specific RNA methylase IME4